MMSLVWLPHAGIVAVAWALAAGHFLIEAVRQLPFVDGAQHGRHVPSGF
ncbi:hypothetical protein [Frankia sp. CcI49]|nr:hypothetical protein [Frankia sp. CcI49]